jgi:hypothetical protein
MRRRGVRLKKLFPLLLGYALVPSCFRDFDHAAVALLASVVIGDFKKVAEIHQHFISLERHAHPVQQPVNPQPVPRFLVLKISPVALPVRKVAL